MTIHPKAQAYIEQSDEKNRVEQGRVLRRPAPRHIGEILRDLGWLPKGEDEPVRVDDDVVRFPLPALLLFDFEPGGVHRSNQGEVTSF